MPAITQYVVDRIEDGEWIVLESSSGNTLEVPVMWAPTDIAEGDVVNVKVEHEGARAVITLTTDSDATEARRERLRFRRDRLRHGPKGDLSL